MTYGWLLGFGMKVASNDLTTTCGVCDLESVARQAPARRMDFSNSMGIESKDV